MHAGDWVKVTTPYGKAVGVVEAIDEDSTHNNWRKHPERYPIVVRLQKPYKVFGKLITHMTFDWQGFPTKWERFARINQLELY